MRHPLRFVPAALLAALVFAPAAADAQTPYKMPPEEVRRILDAPPLPSTTVGPNREVIVLAQRAAMPTIAELSRPMLRLAGRRIDPGTNGLARPTTYTSLQVKHIQDGRTRDVRTPEGASLGYPSFSPDGRRIAFEVYLDDGIELWTADVASGEARRVAQGLNRTSTSCDWTPDSRRLLCGFIPAGRGAPPAEPRVPAGPTIQEAAGGRAAPVRTYQDLLEDAHDEALFDYYFSTQLAYVDAASGQLTRVGEPRIYTRADLSPSGEYLLTTWVERPYSYLFPMYDFPQVTEVWAADGRSVRRLADMPLQENVPIRGVPTGPRSFDWRASAPATLVWAEALDEGDPKKDVEVRDRVLLLLAPFAGEPQELFRTPERYAGFQWGPDSLALLSSYDRIARQRQTWILDVERPSEPARLLWNRSTERIYDDPGSPLLEPTPNGEYVLKRHGEWIFLRGDGASPEGERPFLDRLSLRTLETERLWRSEETHFEQVVAILDDEGRRLLTRRESRLEPPNYFVVEVPSGQRTALTDFADPAPQLTGIEKRLVVYERDDGVQLSGTLYLPPGYQPGQRLPVVVWAYPREFVDPDAAGQVRAAPNRFTFIRGTSHLLFLTQGYAVLDGPSMPIIGGETANDTYVEQLVASAAAAVDEMVELGVGDRDRFGVGGHSYGAFMTGNLLAHSDLFRAGIARSGAYNRTLTPFGFQNESRTYWEAPEIYHRMSPFMHAGEVDEPILLIHGEADNNSGTFPIQSERFFHALKGMGARARLVMLPRESHGYAARESVMHSVAEMLEWFERYVKNAGPRDTATDTTSEP